MSDWMMMVCESLEVLIVIVGQGHHLCMSPLLAERFHLFFVHVHFDGLEGECFNEGEVWIAGEGPEDPEEGLLVLVVAFGGDVVVLEASLAVEGDLARLDLTVLDVDLVAHHDCWDVLHDARQVLVPFRQRFVGDARGHVEHQNGGLCADVVALSESSEFLLACSVPEIEADGSVGGIEGDGAHFYSLCGDVLLFELSGLMPPHKGSFAHSSVPHQDHLELCSQLHSVAVGQSLSYACFLHNDYTQIRLTCQQQSSKNPPKKQHPSITHFKWIMNYTI